MNANAGMNTRTRGQKRKKKGVPGRIAIGTNLSAPLNLKSQQFAAWTPLQTFSVTTGSTPGGIRVRGRELLTTVTSGPTASLFSVSGVPLNPSNFPRLGAYVPIYEMFVFHVARAMYQSNQPTTAAGVVELAFDYDAKDALPSTTVGMMRNISSAMSNIYADCACDLKKSLSRLPKYNTAEGSSSDLDQVNQALLLVATEGFQTASIVVGYLLVEYDVEFFTPQ